MFENEWKELHILHGIVPEFLNLKAQASDIFSPAASTGWYSILPSFRHARLGVTEVCLPPYTVCFREEVEGRGPQWLYM